MKGFFRSRLILSLMTVVLLAGAIAVTLVPNLAHSHAQGTATVTLNPTSGPPGTSVTATGSNWIAGHQIQVELESGTVLATTTVQNNGTFTVTFTIPTNA